MAYYRFTRLQQYINGQPTDVYSKGERVDDVDYSTYDECMGGTTNTRWVSMPQTVCYNGDLWSMEKEEISYDGGITWADTGNTRRASVIEPSASQCTGADSDWRVVYGEYICDGTSKCIKEAEYINNSPTGRTRAGSIVELLSGDCGVMYQWVDVPGEYVCVYKCGRADKYTKQKQQYSIDGVHWEDTGETREGNFIEKNSADCGCDTSVTRWITVSEEYVCVGTSKYTKEKEQTSTDGTNWEDTGNTRAGSLIETSSSSCVSTRWVTVSGQYSCVGTDKYNLEKEQQSTDGGEHWTDTGATRTGSTLIEANSEDCGYIEPIYQWVTVSGEYVCVGTTKYSKEKQQISYDNGVTWSDTGETRTGSTLIEADSTDCGGGSVDNPGFNLNGLTFSNQGYFGADNSSNYTQKTSVSVPDKLLVFDSPSEVSAYESTDPFGNAGNEGKPGYFNLLDVSSTDSIFSYQGIGCKKNGKYSVFGVSVDNIINTVTFDYSSLSEVPECPYDLQIDYGVWPTSTGSWPSGWGGYMGNIVFKSGGENYSAWETRALSNKKGVVVIHNFSKNGVFFSLPNQNNYFKTIGVNIRKTNSTHNFAVLGIQPVSTSLTRYGNLMVFDMDEYKVYKSPILSYDQWNNDYNRP